MAQDLVRKEHPLEDVPLFAILPYVPWLSQFKVCRWAAANIYKCCCCCLKSKRRGSVLIERSNTAFSFMTYAGTHGSHVSLNKETESQLLSNLDTNELKKQDRDNLADDVFKEAIEEFRERDSLS